MSPAIPPLVADDISGQLPELATALRNYLPQCRWFGSKARTIETVEVDEFFPLATPAGSALLLIIRVGFSPATTERYVVPVALVNREVAVALQPQHSSTVILSNAKNADQCWIDALAWPAFCHAFLATLLQSQLLQGSLGNQLRGSIPNAANSWTCEQLQTLTPHVSKAEQSNSSVRFGDAMMLKLIRRLDPGRNPELEFGQFFSQQTLFRHYAPYLGALEYHRTDSPPITLAILQGLVPNQGDAWQYTLAELSRFFKRVSALNSAPPNTQLSLCAATREANSPSAITALDAFLPAVEKLGRHTGEMHLALAAKRTDVDFAPEPFTLEYQRSLHASMSTFHQSMLDLLSQRLSSIPALLQAHAQQLLGLRSVLTTRLDCLLHTPLDAERIRCHGDYHLGQVLFTGDDFVIIDFEGPPMLPIAERNIKRSALCDVAGMIRSFHYAALTGAGTFAAAGAFDTAGWASAWYRWTSAAFLRSYVRVTQGASFSPKSWEVFQQTLELYLLDKAMYELGYELNHRPDWVSVPLRGIVDILSATPSAKA
jgi:maltose alpha-D-glucosyltransferase / alpha-amylase